MDHALSPTRHFHTSLQELKGLQPQLYSAAEYCEASYLFNDQKKVVLENLKDYAVKALVNTIDHLGTVAYNMNEVLSLQISEISSTGIRVASLAQRVHTCKKYKDLEELSNQWSTRANQRYHKHYLPPDAMHNCNEQLKEKMEERIDEPEISRSHPVIQEAGKTLLWYLTAEHPNSPKVATQMPRSTNRVPCLSIPSESPVSGPSSIGSSSTFASTECNNHIQTSSMVVPKPTGTSHISLDEMFGCHERGNTSSRRRGFLSSLLRRTRN